MPLASMENVGPYLGLYEVETPSGVLVSITPEEEAAITKQAILYELEQELTRRERFQEAVVQSAIGAVGNMVGFAAGGWLLGKVLGMGAGAGMMGR